MTTTETAEGFDPSALRVNFTDKEAASTALEPLPVGKYDVFITECTPQQSGSEKNKGKWMYNVEFTVDGGPYNSRKAWTYACLWDGALYTISQMMKATGVATPEGGGDAEIPPPEHFVGKPVTIVIGMGKAQIGTGTKEAPQYPARPEVKGVKAREGADVKSGGKKGSKSLLPG
jgi:hypothetical protein